MTKNEEAPSAKREDAISNSEVHLSKIEPAQVRKNNNIRVEQVSIWRPSASEREPGRDRFECEGSRTFWATQQRCDREVAVDMLPCCRRGAGVAGAARRDHDGYSDTPGRPILPDGGTLPRLAHAEKNSETACSRVTDESVRVTPRVPYRSHTSINSLWPH